MKDTKKIAVVLFNLGGPDKLQSVQPFLNNLFKDPAIIQIPSPFRQILAHFISKKRAPIAQEIYENIGGKSPILEETKAQEKALEKQLLKFGNYKVFTSMRYWHPFSSEVVSAVKNYNPDEIILLPLYPQFSTTTTLSSFNDWEKEADKQGLKTTTKKTCCYGTHEKFIQAQVNLIQPFLDQHNSKNKLRLLFSAHGLPQKIVDQGDPYEKQVYATVEKITTQLNLHYAQDMFDTLVCFQSRVGPLKWLSPSLDDALKAAADDRCDVIIIPIAFVSEHSETLVELDIEYKKISHDLGIPSYQRVPTLSTNEDFIGCLRDIVLKISSDNTPISSFNYECCGGKCGKVKG